MIFFSFVQSDARLSFVFFVTILCTYHRFMNKVVLFLVFLLRTICDMYALLFLHFSLLAVLEIFLGEYLCEHLLGMRVASFAMVEM